MRDAENRAARQEVKERGRGGRGGAEAGGGSLNAQVRGGSGSRSGGSGRLAAAQAKDRVSEREAGTLAGRGRESEGSGTGS